MKDALGRYRINAVAELTALPPGTLRAWERRYGIPTPARTASSYRLYSDVDLAELERLRDLCASGIGIGEAARRVRSDRETLPCVVPPVREFPSAAALVLESVLAAVIDFDPPRIQREVSRALYIGNARETYDLVLAPALRRIGELWSEGKLSIAQEHISSEIIHGVSSSLVRLTQPSEPRWRVLLACVEKEQHFLGLHGVAIQLASWGIESTILGALMPPQAVADAIAYLKPDAIGLSITIAREPGECAEPFNAYVAAFGGRPWFAGGTAVRDLAKRIRAHGGLPLVGALADHRKTIEKALGRHTPARA
jgi:MerR family transcriptional regulator, light-induced transcriptional regulator